MKVYREHSLAKWIIFATGLLSIPFGAVDAATTQASYFVSPGGSDANPGTEALPFQTIEKARDVVRTVNGAMTGDIVVTLRGGTYPLTSTVNFGTADGGQNGYYVRYVNYTGETPLLTGGQPITGWTISDAGKGIWKATGVTSRFRQLYVNGTKAIRARSPNLNADGSANFARVTGVDAGAHNVQVPSSVVSNWNNLTKVEMHLMTAWSDNVLRLASYTTSGSTAYIKFQTPEDTILYVRPWPSVTAWAVNAKAYFLENAFEFLDQPGEWYLDESANTLYYMPRSGENMASATVVAPILENLVTVTGPSTSQMVGYLSFQGLAFAHSTYMRPSNAGFLNYQAGQYTIATIGATTDHDHALQGRPAGGVVITNAHHIRFERNLFAQMAATGLDFVSGTHDDMIVGNVFTDIGGSGISIGKFVADSNTDISAHYNPTDKNEICTSDTLSNNFIDNVTTENLGACGIAAGCPRYIYIAHNEVSHTNYTGISVGFGSNNLPNAMTNNKIYYNHIHHVIQILADGSSLYTQCNQGPASEMEYNYVHDFAQSQWADYQCPAMYLDNGTEGYTCAHNVMINTPGWIAENGSDVQANNTVTDNGDNPSGAANTMAIAGIEPAYIDIKSRMTIPVPNFKPAPTIPAHRDSVFNGGFDLGTLGWTFNVWEGGAHGSVVNGEYDIQIDSIGQHNSGIQLVQNGIILEQGRSYEVKFDAYSTANRTLETNVEQDVSPWASYLTALQSFNLTTTKTTFSYVFTMTNPTDSNGRVSFNAGASTGSVFLDNISVKLLSAGIRSAAEMRGPATVVRLDHSRLQVEFGSTEGKGISLGIFDLSGKQVRSGSFRAGSGQVQSWTSDLSGMPRGVYVLGIDADGKSIHRSKFLYGD